MESTRRDHCAHPFASAKSWTWNLSRKPTTHPTPPNNPNLSEACWTKAQRAHPANHLVRQDHRLNFGSQFGGQGVFFDMGNLKQKICVVSSITPSFTRLVLLTCSIKAVTT